MPIGRVVAWHSSQPLVGCGNGVALAPGAGANWPSEAWYLPFANEVTLVPSWVWQCQHFELSGFCEGPAFSSGGSALAVWTIGLKRVARAVLRLVTRLFGGERWRVIASSWIADSDEP